MEYKYLSMNNLLPILAVETTGETCSVAVLINDQQFVELNVKQRHIHSMMLISMVDQVLKSGNLTLNDLKAIAVSMGPGSFTGLRIGLSAVKGLVFGANLPLISVPTFDAYAFHLSKQLPEKSEFIIAVKASIEDYYCAKYFIRNNNVEVIDEVSLLDKSEMKDFCSSTNLIFGNYGTRESDLSALFTAKWAYLFGEDLLTYDYDYLEPNYLKKFVIKGKK